MNILILNWRDIKNPKSGGAEILTHEIAKSWTKAGNQVTLFSSSFPKSSELETVDNIRIIRRGQPDTRFLFFSVHFLAFLYYIKNKKKFDIVLDEIHGIPFFTPWYVRVKRVALICEVADKLWTKMFGPVFGRIGRFMEMFYLKYIYKNTPYLTISNSTKEELINEGVSPQNITVLPMGATPPKRKTTWNKEKTLTLIYVGRLSKSKGIEDAIKATAKTSKDYRSVRLWVVGGGEEKYKNYLKRLARNLGIDKKIIFYDFVSEEKKFELLEKAHILVAPSVKEGWGLTIVEAGFVGTPSVVYNSPGLRDVLYGNKLKTLTVKNTPQDLAYKIIEIFKNYNKFKDYKLNPKDFSWDKTAEAAMKVLKNT